jgi:AhpD family alkylhydroperoxidase
MPQWDILNTLGSYMQFLGNCNLIKQQRKEVVNLAVSQLNGYCQAAHTATGKMNGFTDQIIEQKGEASWDSKTNVLHKLQNALHPRAAR